MPNRHIVVESNIPESFRVKQVESLFDVPLREKIRHEWDVSLPIEDKDWNIGLIVGASGSGKSTIARELFKDAYWVSHEWSGESILDNFPDMPTNDICAVLSACGFSSPPDWCKPYHILSTGQKFRVDVARSISEASDLIVFDEFTSVVDRTVAKFASLAVSKFIRKSNKRFIAVSCHSDIIEWLSPDWIYQPETEVFEWGNVPTRPKIALDLFRVDRKAWRLFAKHHYLSADLHVSSECYCGYYRGVPVAFCAFLHLFGHKGVKRVHRIVVLPDYQGVGIGTQFLNAVCQRVKDSGNRVRITTSHPSLLGYLRKSDKWALARKTEAGKRKFQLGYSVRHAKGKKQKQKFNKQLERASMLRATKTYEYIITAQNL